VLADGGRLRVNRENEVAGSTNAYHDRENANDEGRNSIFTGARNRELGNLETLENEVNTEQVRDDLKHSYH
jgi:hypothetical protein